MGGPPTRSCAYGSGCVTKRKRVELNIDDYATHKERPTARAELPTMPTMSVTSSPPTAGPITHLQARVPVELADRVRDLARARSRGGARKVSVNELLVEAVERYLDQE